MYSLEGKEAVQPGPMHLVSAPKRRYLNAYRLNAPRDLGVSPDETLV